MKLLLGEVWGVILDDFGTYLGAILEALEVILGAWGPFWRLFGGSWRLLEALGGSGSCFKAVEALGKS